ncbi:ATP synthase subunit d, mitochondrial [Agrilus planipennis]|uniref:ATP synthase subunit d, mitochondrial n=1 Tax=Agrilus planipennis TaxID=224129 RepID=A0A1W4W3M6_AGRPL|nr:ATP synthase subunit d, mitochondrial [Agrilus planipennis]
MSKRLIPKAFNWSALAERVPPHQKQQFNMFKVLSEGYLSRVLAYPEEPPKIDWTSYEKNIHLPGLVADFRKQYETLKVPYPPDTVTSKITEQEKQLQVEIQNIKTESNARIAEYKKQIDHLLSLLPFDQMTMEDFKDAYPDIAIDPLNKPTFWPHNPEEQPGYVDKDAPQSGH